MKFDLPSVLVSIKDGVIDLGWGHPSTRLHPVKAIRMASERLLASDASEPLQYGATQGFGPFLESLAGFLSRQPAMACQLTLTTCFSLLVPHKDLI